MAQQGVTQAGAGNHDFARTGRMAIYGGGSCSTHMPYTSSIRTLTDPPLSSHLRSGSDIMVQVPRHQNMSPQQEFRNYSPGSS